MELLDSPRRPPQETFPIAVVVLTAAFMALALIQLADPHALGILWEALVRAWGDIQAFAWTFFLLSTIFYRTAGPAIQGERGKEMKKLKTRAFGKFVSLIPEGVKARLNAIERRIKEVVEK